MHYDNDIACMFPYLFFGRLAMHADNKERHPVRPEATLGA